VYFGFRLNLDVFDHYVNQTMPDEVDRQGRGYGVGGVVVYQKEKSLWIIVTT
jgi:hypothetical protein